jgi:hypothetical protein
VAVEKLADFDFAKLFRVRKLQVDTSSLESLVHDDERAELSCSAAFDGTDCCPLS